MFSEKIFFNTIEYYVITLYYVYYNVMMSKNINLYSNTDYVYYAVLMTKK